MNKQLTRLQKLAGLIKENQLPGEVIDAATSAERAIKILLRHNTVNSDTDMRDTFENALMMINALLHPEDAYVHEKKQA
jgi:hypothetical protein